MNERIKELVKQAADYANTYSDAGADVWFEIYNKKFAELIVRECVELATKEYNNRGAIHGNDLLKHFGVEA